MVSENKDSKATKKVLKLSSLAGVVRAIAGFPLEQPLEAMKTQWQANPGFKHEVAIARSMYQANGIQSFFAGSLPNFMRGMVKQMYRFPLMVALPGFFEKTMPNSIRENKKVQKLLTGITIAVVESFILCPFERLKTYFMTARALDLEGKGIEKPVGKVGFRSFIAESNSNLASSLFKGMFPLFLRQSVAWIGFLQADLKVKQTLRRRYQIKESEAIPSRLLIPASACVAVFSTMIIMPFDAMKTQQQQFKISGARREKYTTLMRQVYRESGMRGFFVGWRIRLSLYLIHSFMTVVLLEKLDYHARRIWGVGK